MAAHSVASRALSPFLSPSAIMLSGEGCASEGDAISSRAMPAVTIAIFISAPVAVGECFMPVRTCRLAIPHAAAAFAVQIYHHLLASGGAFLPSSVVVMACFL